MKIRHYYPLSLLAIAVVTGCSSVPNPSLTEAHERFNSARSNSAITNLAAVELKDAEASLTKADYAFKEDEDESTVNHLAYLAKQQVSIAEETSNRKTAELVVANSSAKRDQIRLNARTNEADAANQAVKAAHAANDRQATELAVADANSERDRALIAEQELQLKALNAKKTERGLVITLGDVLFSTDKYHLKSGGIRKMQKLADFLTQFPDYKVKVEGHTDSVGNDDYNQRLSERRASSVQSTLINMSISSDRVSEQGYGEMYPVASNNNVGGRQLNRRVEIILSDSSGNIVSR